MIGFSAIMKYWLFISEQSQPFLKTRDEEVEEGKSSSSDGTTEQQGIDFITSSKIE